MKPVLIGCNNIEIIIYKRKENLSRGIILKEKAGFFARLCQAVEGEDFFLIQVYLIIAKKWQQKCHKNVKKM